MNVRLVRRSAWLATTALLAAAAVAWSQAPPPPERVMLAAVSNAAQPVVRQVLLLQSFPRGNMPDDHLTGNFHVDVDRMAGQAVNVVQIVVGATGFVGAPEQATVDYIRSAFADRPRPDLIVTLAGPAAAFARKYRQQLFPDVPLLLASVNQQYLRDAPLAENETSVAVASDFPGVIDLILELLPQTKQVFVVVGSGQSGTFWGRELQARFTRFQDRLTFSWSGGLSLTEIVRQCASLPRDSAILYLSLGTDGRGGAYADARVLADLHAVANAPIFGLHSVMLGAGIVGGKLIDIDELSRSTADAATRILAGAPPRSVRVPPQPPGRPVFDWRELQRWGISESRLPAGSVVRYRDPSLWQQHRGTVLSAVGVLGLQSVLIIGLVYQRRARRRAEIESRSSEAELRETKERLLLAAEAAHLGVWIRDLTRNDVWATDSWRALFGFSTSERLDLDGIWGRLHPDDRETVQCTLAGALEGDGRYELEHRVVLPSGEIRWIASRGRAQFNGAGTPILVRGVSLDVTERRKVEREAQLLRQEVAHVGRVSMMGQLASALAHEINQPLGAILRNAEAAELFLQSASPDLEEVRASLADIVKNDQRAGAVIDRMRALLKRHELEVIRLDVGDVIGDVMTLMRADAVSRHVKLDLDIAGDLPPVRGDRVHLQQVLLNLVFNGMDALNGTQGDRRVTVTARPNGNRTVEIAVGDTGPGIPADMLATIFDPFFSTKRDGMGMGLSISRTIIEAHGGQLWAESNHVQGATLRFTLPIAEEAAAG
jgi:PAS domain S-box-containing protein